MQRTVSAELGATTTAGTEVVLSVAVADPQGYEAVVEDLSVLVDGRRVTVEERQDRDGTRLHFLTTEDAARLEIRYHATVTGAAAPAPGDPLDLVRYVRPSRYCESDRILPTAYAQFPDLTGADLARAVRDWVAAELSYVSGSSRFTDGAVDTLLSRRGVCRDYAHLVIALLRARDVPARLVSVYAPGLSPMDFHAVVEAWVDGAWLLLDATGLAPRSSMLRIATGRDATDTSFLSTVGGQLTLTNLSVTATVDSLPFERGGDLTLH
ncbi:transglutaminase family protein [Arthrobacter agilis]|uniref:transglutaminase-like domain-containing protein n=1 Tax=Arthrobacter agilis TaxID=37921 RepID=UPI000B353CD5|nr:transglutaminase family protein [Arthrobacter agilis]OUM44135.1 transglutaminase [Arthrobacter agilis]PPB46511.1 transglutaminase family protein [Arthrobacter agilis]TPV23833.1 transglutaminase family protein [Arthrobacter agilis]VDR32569.1 Transglutaminase-like superfamily [Arthrobacter agilis]